MSCNCKKDKTELNKRKDIRRKAKDALATIKRLWQESENNTITTNKDELNFKQKSGAMLRFFFINIYRLIFHIKQI